VNADECDELPEEIREIPDEDDVGCGPSEEDLSEFEMRLAA
jgi:hypothetical protein